MAVHVPYQVLEQRQDDVLEVCRALHEVINPDKLHLERSSDGHPIGSKNGCQYHVRITMVESGQQFFMRIAHGEPTTDIDFIVDPTWFHGSIRWIPLHLSVEVRDSFESAYGQWADAQWARAQVAAAKVALQEENAAATPAPVIPHRISRIHTHRGQRSIIAA